MCQLPNNHRVIKCHLETPGFSISSLGNSKTFYLTSSDAIRSKVSQQLRGISSAAVPDRDGGERPLVDVGELRQHHSGRGENAVGV